MLKNVPDQNAVNFKFQGKTNEHLCVREDCKFGRLDLLEIALIDGTVMIYRIYG